MVSLLLDLSNKESILIKLKLLLLEIELSWSKLKLLFSNYAFAIDEIFAIVELLLIVSGEIELITAILAAVFIKDHIKLVYL